MLSIPLQDHTANKLHEAFPGVALCQSKPLTPRFFHIVRHSPCRPSAYGCTELSGPCVQSGVRDTNLPLSAAGALVSNSELRFLDANGKDVGERGPGEITCRGPNVMMYVQRCKPCRSASRPVTVSHTYMK